MNFWKIVFVFLLFFACFLYFSERMLEKTIQQTIQLEEFTNWCKTNNNNKNKNTKKNKINKNVVAKSNEKIVKNQCESYFNTTPYYIFQDCDDTVYKCKPKSKSNKNNSKYENSLCNNLVKNGWNQDWTKTDLQRWKKINSRNMIQVKKARDSIRKNIGYISEEQITKCFPKYI